MAIISFQNIVHWLCWRSDSWKALSSWKRWSLVLAPGTGFISNLHSFRLASLALGFLCIMYYCLSCSGLARPQSQRANFETLDWLDFSPAWGAINALPCIGSSESNFTPAFNLFFLSFLGFCCCVTHLLSNYSLNWQSRCSGTGTTLPVEWYVHYYIRPLSGWDSVFERECVVV